MELFFRKMGMGQPFVFLHGLLGASDTFFNAGRHLSDSFTVYMPDMRNHGRSPHHPVMTYETMCDDLLHFFEQHHIEQPVLAGHSMGGKLAMMYALKYPDKIKKLIVIDIALKAYPIINKTYISPAMSLDFEQFSSRTDIRNYLTDKISDFRIVDLLLKNITWKNNNKLGWRANFNILYKSFDNLLIKIESKNCFPYPTLFIYGEKSEYFNQSDFLELKANFSNMQTAMIPDAGHWVFSDNYTAFIKTVDDFLVSEI